MVSNSSRQTRSAASAACKASRAVFTFSTETSRRLREDQYSFQRRSTSVPREARAAGALLLRALVFVGCRLAAFLALAGVRLGAFFAVLVFFRAIGTLPPHTLTPEIPQVDWLVP